MEHVDIIVIGAGVVGLSVAARLSRPGSTLFVIEKNDSFGQETSSRNSEVIHAGIYYPPGSLKARLCARGNEMLYEICSREGIPHKRTEKLIVATNAGEETELEKLFENGRKNGVPGLKLLSEDETKKMEPEIRARAALYSPSTGIVDTHELMKYFANDLKHKGSDIVYRSEVIGLNKATDGYEVTIKEERETFKIHAGIVINCAGLNSDTISALAGIDAHQNNYSLKYCKGQYFRISDRKKCRLISRLIYPVPREKSAGLGVHATLDLAGSVRLGPDARYIERDDVNYDVDLSDRGEFFASAREFMPFLLEETLVPDTAGIRPKLQGPGEDFRDFIIKEETELGLPGFVDLIGIESPGLTSAPAIAEYVENLIN